MHLMIRYKFFPALLSFLAAVALESCSSSEGKTEGSKQPAAPSVAVTTVRKEQFSSTLQLPAELIAWQQVDLYAKENSFVRKLYVDVGSQVKAGQLLASMEAPELNARLAGAESRLKSLEAIYTGSKANYDRLYETSKTPGTISQNDLDQAEARKNSDHAQWQAARASYREVSDTRNYLEIRAPFSGVISVRNANAGAYAGPSGKGSELPLFTLQEQQRLRLVVSVPEAYTAYLNEQSEISFTVRSRPSESFRAKVNRLAGALDNRLRSERIEMDVDNKDGKLLPGMIAEATLHISPSDSSFVVPKTAVVNSTERVVVIRIRDGKAEWVDVKKGREADGKVEVFGDLNEGDQVVRAGNDELHDGTAVGHVSTAADK